MSIYDVNGNELSTQGGGGRDEGSAIIAASEFNTFKSGADPYKRNLTFAVISDIHGSSQALSDFITYVNSKSDYLDFAVFLGDLASVNGSEGNDWYNNRIYYSQIPFYPIVGNHDIRTVSLSTALTKLFSVPKTKGWMVDNDFGDESNGYWYKDFSGYNIRIIGLMEYDNADLLKTDGTNAGKRWIDSDQLQWFADTLYSTPSGYSVILFTHQALRETETMITHSFTMPNISTTAMENAINGEPIGDILNAFITGGSISATYSPTSDMASKIQKTATVSKDFSGRGTGKFICHICGHKHSPLILQDTTYSSIKSIVVPSGSADAYQRQWDDIRYKSNDVNKNNFYIIGVNTTSKKINLVKIGGYATINMTERFFDRLSY